jgi:nucleoside-diphosphate-sugar epimerase
MKRLSVSVTGATGFVGWHTVEALLTHGCEVRAVVRRGNRKPVPDGAAIVEADLSAESLERAFEDTDVVIHSAALIRARDAATFAAVNVEGTRAAASAAVRTGARLVLISSQAAGGQGTPEAPRLESDPPAPVNAYGRSKLASEEVVRTTADLRWVILRPCAVYGPRDHGFLPLFRMAERGLFLVPSDERTSFTLVHVSDLARAVQLAAMSDAAIGETLFLGHAQPHTGLDVLRAIARATSRPFKPRHVPVPLVVALAKTGDLLWKLGVKPTVDSGRLAELRANGFVCSVARAREVLGFEAATDLQDGMAETARWYRAQGWI